MRVSQYTAVIGALATAATAKPVSQRQGYGYDAPLVKSVRVYHEAERFSQD